MYPATQRMFDAIEQIDVVPEEAKYHVMLYYDRCSKNVTKYKMIAENYFRTKFPQVTK